MRNLVQPPPSMHCELCHGELRLRLIEPDDSVLDMEVHKFRLRKVRLWILLHGDPRPLCCAHHEKYVGRQVIYLVGPPDISVEARPRLPAKRITCPQPLTQFANSRT